MWVKKNDGEYVNLEGARKVIVTDYAISAVYNNGKDDRVEVLATSEQVPPCLQEFLRCVHAGEPMADFNRIAAAAPAKGETKFLLNSEGRVLSG